VSKRREFVVRLDMPEGVTALEMEGYIEDAVACWKGRCGPDDPIYNLDGKSVRARLVPQPRKAEGGAA
jgi:hypothetical protein